jgi:Lipase (class 3)
MHPSRPRLAGPVQWFILILISQLIGMHMKHYNHLHIAVHGFSRSYSFLSKTLSKFERTKRMMAILDHPDSNQNSDMRSTNVDDDTTTASTSQAQADQDLSIDDEDNEFSAWIVSNLKQWPLLNMESSESQNNLRNAPTATALYETTLNSSSNSGSNVWNDVGTLLLQSTILPFGNTSSTTPSETATSAITSYLRSPLSQVFNVEYILPLLNPSMTKDKESQSITKNIDDTSRETSTITASSSDASPAPTAVTPTTPNDSILKQATSRIEAIVTEASNVVSSDTVMALINKASELVRSSSSSSSSPPSSTVSSPITSAFPSVIDDPASNSKLDTLTPSIVRDSVTTYATSILRIADGLLRKGYVNGDIIAQKLLKGRESILKDVPIVTDSQALFNEYRSVKEINTASYELIKSTEMGALAGAIYEDTIPRTHALRQTIVARGTSAHVTWMISDSIANHTSFTTKMDADSRQQPFLVRTITIRGFDASDESVDREELLNQICTATPVPLWNNTAPQQQLQEILVHSGLLSIARTIYADIKKYVDWTASSHKLVLNGHSIGGSIAILLLMLMIQDYGMEYVRKKIVQVYTFGSPPVTVMRDPTMNVLSALDIPSGLIQGYVQPWDPIVRLFTVIDALYPLVSDLGPDNTTPFANGPPRALRPLLKSILVSWAGWPRFRDNYKGTAKQSYASVGVQHIILPEPTRYLADRFLAVNIPVPPVETIVQISSDELYLALATIFPLDVFEVSYIPQAIRSFVHHFYPAYGFPLVDYVKELQRRSRGLPERKSEFAFSEDDVTATTSSTPSTNDGGIDWGKATQWLTRNDSKS